MSFGVSGCHGSGKTTLAKELADAAGIPFYSTNTTEVLAEIGMSGVVPLTMDLRMVAQEHLLENHWKVTQGMKRPFICDRTPLDMIAYTLGEVTMHNTDPKMGERVAKYVERAMWIARNTYLAVIITRPLSDYEDDPKRPPKNEGYQALCQTLIEGAMFNLVGTSRMILPMQDHERRVEVSLEFIAKSLEEANKAKPVLH